MENAKLGNWNTSKHLYDVEVRHPDGTRCMVEVHANNRDHKQQGLRRRAAFKFAL